MSHTTQFGATSFIHNGDPFESNDSPITIIRGQKRIDIPMGDLIDFVGEMLKDAKIAQLEQMEARDFLKVPPVTLY